MKLSPWSCRSTARSAIACRSRPVMSEQANTELALKSEAVIKNLDGKAPRKVIYVPDKLVNIVA